MDSEPVEEVKKGDLIKVTTDFLGNISYKLIFFLFMAFLFISSDVFSNNVLSKIDGAIELNDVTTYGTIVQGVILILFYLTIDMAIKADLV